MRVFSELKSHLDVREREDNTRLALGQCVEDLEQNGGEPGSRQGWAQEGGPPPFCRVKPGPLALG